MPYYHSLQSDWRSSSGRKTAPWKEGTKRSVKNAVIMCSNGFHACPMLHDVLFTYNFGPIICEVELTDISDNRDLTKVVAKTRKLIAAVDVRDVFKAEYKKVTKLIEEKKAKTIAEVHQRIDDNISLLEALKELDPKEVNYHTKIDKLFRNEVIDFDPYDEYETYGWNLDPENAVYDLRDEYSLCSTEEIVERVAKALAKRKKVLGV